MNAGAAPRSYPSARAVAGGPGPEEVVAVATDLAHAAAQLVATADALVTAPPEARPTLRATLYRWQTVLALGARRLAQLGGGHQSRSPT